MVLKQTVLIQEFWHRLTPWKNFPREMLLLGDDMKEWMEEDGQAKKENIPSSKHMKSDHSKIQFGPKVPLMKKLP